VSVAALGWVFGGDMGQACASAARATRALSAVFGLHVIAHNLIRLGNLLRPTTAAA